MISLSMHDNVFAPERGTGVLSPYVCKHDDGYFAELSFLLFYFEHSCTWHVPAGETLFLLGEFFIDIFIELSSNPKWHNYAKISLPSCSCRGWRERSPVGMGWERSWLVRGFSPPHGFSRWLKLAPLQTRTTQVLIRALKRKQEYFSW